MIQLSKFINSNFIYIDVAANDIDYKVIDHGLETFDLLGFEKKFTILDCSQNFTESDVIHKIANSMVHCDIPGLLLSPDPNINTDKIKYFPIFACYGMTVWNRTIVMDQRRNYLYSCLNRNPHLHRIINWLSLRDVPNGLWSIYNLPQNNILERTDYTADFIDQWSQEKQKLSVDCSNDLSCNHPAFTQSYINIVTETVMRNTVFVSEKTWKPVAAGQLFLVVGCVGTIAYLRNIGVDVFDDIVDHSYDSEPDWFKRIQALQLSFKKLVSQDIDSIWKQTLHRRQKNQTNFFNGMFVDPYVTEINNFCTNWESC